MKGNDVFGIVVMAILFVAGCFFLVLYPVTFWDCSRDGRAVRCTVEDKAGGIVSLKRTVVDDVRSVEMRVRVWKPSGFGRQSDPGGRVFTLILVDGAGREHPLTSHFPSGSYGSEFHLGAHATEIRTLLKELIAGGGKPFRASQVDWVPSLLTAVFTVLPLVFFVLLPLAPVLPWNRARAVPSDKWIRSFLATIPRERAVGALVGVLSDSDAALRAAACDALASMGPAAAEAVSALNERLGDSSERVRRAAQAALAKIGVASASAT
jgi:hypothetical protein